MASLSTPAEVRKQARQRAAEAAAERERLARERFDAEIAVQREQAKANENDLAAFYGAEAAITEAEEKLATVKQLSAVTMSEAAQAIATREGSVSAAARLLGVSAGKVSAIIKAGVPRTSTQSAPTTASAPVHKSSSDGGGEDQGSDETGAVPAPEGSSTGEAVSV